MQERLTFRKGLKDGIPICLGYLSVSFTFGMMAAKGSLPLWITQLISMTNLTSAGQFAGTALILTGGAFLEIAVTTLVINLRYTLMTVDEISRKTGFSTTSNFIMQFQKLYGITPQKYRNSKL